MLDDVQVRVEAEQILGRLGRMPQDQQAAVRRAMAIGLLEMESHVRIRADLKRRRGAAGLMGRLTSRVIDLASGRIDGLIGFRKTRGFPYEYAQEFGAKAKPGKAMAVPVSAEARAMSGRGLGPRKFPRKLFVPFGTHVLAERRTPRARTLVTHYVLMKSIPPRLNFRKTVQDATPTLLRLIVMHYRRATGATAS